MNSRSRTGFFLAPIALVVSLLAHAQAPSPAATTRVISFEEAVAIALEQNEAIRQGRNATELGQLSVEQARKDFLPDLRFSSGVSQNFGRNFDESEGSIVDTSQRTTNLGLSSGVAVFDGFANTATLQGAKDESAAIDQDYARTRETVVFTVSTNFLSLVQRQEQLRVQRENLQAQVALEQQIETYVKAGARTIADLYQQQANVASAQLAVVEAERAADVAVIDVIRTLQLDPRGIYEFVPPKVGDGEDIDVETLDALITKAYGTRADIGAAASRVEAAGQDIRVAKSTRWPIVGLSAGYNSSFNSASDYSWDQQLDQRRGGSVGLSFVLPLYDRSATAIATRRAQLAADNAQIALESLQQEVGAQVRTALLDLDSARAQLTTAQAQLRAAERALEVTDQRYRAGAATLVELTQSRATQVSAAGNYVSAKYGVEFQRRLLDYYVGGLTADKVRFQGPSG